MKLIADACMLALCFAIMYLLSALYVIIGAVATTIALFAGVWQRGRHELLDVGLAIVVGVCWPAIVVAYVFYRVKLMRTAQALGLTSRGAEPRLRCVEDFDERGRRDQRRG